MNAVNYASYSKDALIDICTTQQRALADRDNKLHLLQNKALPMPLRLGAIAACEMERIGKPGEDGYYRAHLPALAESVGVSPSTMSRALHRLADETNALDHRLEKDRHDPRKEIVYIRPADLLHRPGEIVLTKEVKRHGGSERCKCGGEIVVKRRVLKQQEHSECNNCHAVYRVFPAQEVNEAWDPTESTPFQDETVDVSPGQDVPFQDETVCQAQDAPLQSATSSIQVQPIADCTATAHLAILNAAAQLLLEIAGPGPKAEHIEMPGDGTDKYKTIHRRLVAGDLRAHIYGHTTKGATLQHENDQARALTFDADTPEDLQKLKQAARQLAIADFNPLLELSPVPAGHDHAGGGKLWIIFDALVDAYSALQTTYQYAPMLREMKEYWPRPGNHRVRLPGGKYIKPGFAAWCSLYDADGNELSHDGPDAAAVLLARQTPASVVREYDKLITEPPPQPAKRAPQAGEYLEKNDARRAVDDFNASHSWEEIASPTGGINRKGKFAASWRGDRTPNVAVNPRTDLAKDFARPDEPAMDKYDVWCRIEGGATWQEFRRRDLAERCKHLREREQAQATAPTEPPPNRLTICHGAGWEWNGSQYVCAQCHGKKEQAA